MKKEFLVEIIDLIEQGKKQYYMDFEIKKDGLEYQLLNELIFLVQSGTPYYAKHIADLRFYTALRDPSVDNETIERLLFIKNHPIEILYPTTDDFFNEFQMHFDNFDEAMATKVFSHDGSLESSEINKRFNKLRLECIPNSEVSKLIHRFNFEV